MNDAIKSMFFVLFVFGLAFFLSHLFQPILEATK